MEKMDNNIVRRHISDMLRYGRNNDARMIDSGIGFFTEGAKNPTVAQIIRKDEVLISTKNMIKDTLDNGEGLKGVGKKLANTLNNLSDLHNFPEFDKARQSFDNKIETLYPRTKDIREKLVDSGKIVMNKVTPKAGWFKKLRLLKYMPL